ncbi:hypothetical protein SpAn4DRAFT_2606 [Sporomusa ovata]|uniref:Uncharacterized protein n=1 Tax=Sporomusa ovata TaxID=2378 RepID=A0A0U1L385_9FIRM|nr:hypothetical protein SpAn4DRAFT_2606 [Sporomusa ovata]
MAIRHTPITTNAAIAIVVIKHTPPGLVKLSHYSISEN